MKTLSEILQTKKEKGSYHLHCKVCRYDWISRVKDPKECPVCNSRYWRTGKTESGKKAFSIVDGNKLE
jgi:rubrerythrin